MSCAVRAVTCLMCELLPGPSARAVDSDFKGSADLAHAGVCQPAQAFDEYRDRDTLD